LIPLRVSLTAVRLIVAVFFSFWSSGAVERFFQISQIIKKIYIIFGEKKLLNDLRNLHVYLFTQIFTKLVAQNGQTNPQSHSKCIHFLTWMVRVKIPGLQ